MDGYETMIVKPLEGIEWKGQTVLLGGTRAEVQQVFGKPEKEKDAYYYFDSNLRIDFDDEGRVEFIEFLGSVDATVRPIIYDKDAFECMADEIYQLLKEKNHGRMIDEEDGYSYAFVNLSVGVYRECLPADIEEMEEEGASEEELEEEKKLAYHWATIGIGVKGYYQI